MAIQNFLSGGFYGKVGDVVGQRWHNKRTIRAYVKPANPQTPAQQANRQLFAHATKLAQQAFNVNKGHTSWDTTEKGEFSQRVSTALRRLKLGYSDAEALPLYPDGYGSVTPLENARWVFRSYPYGYTIQSDAPILTSPRTFRQTVRAYRVGYAEMETFSRDITIEAGKAFSSGITINYFYSFIAGSWGEVATIDDEQNDGNSIVMPRLENIAATKPTTSFNVWPQSFTYNAADKTLDFQVSMHEFDRDFSGKIYIWSYWGSNPQPEQIPFDFSFKKGKPQIIKIPAEWPYRFPAGSYICPVLTVMDTPEAKIELTFNKFDFQYP